ncbi:MAG: H-NS histone family protein [Sulfitobacter sp.]
MTRKELEKLRGDVDRELARTIERDKKAAMAAAKKAAREHGFDLSDFTEEPKPKKARKKAAKKPSAAPKYANPADKSQKWTGKGRQPQWFKDAIAAGKKPEDLAI